MILADKIIQQRKKAGWSQEELAEKMQVSRQAVSKWEGAQSVPDLERILMLSRLFGVTTDYLLKDEIEGEAYAEAADDAPVRRIALAQANEFLEFRKVASVRIAAGVFLCILAVIPLLILGAASEVPTWRLSEDLACGVGLAALLLLVVPAVALFLSCGMKNAPYDFLDGEPFSVEYGVTGMVRERQREYRGVYIRSNIIGACLCVLSPVPLFLGASTQNEFYTVVTLAATLLLAGIGSVFFIIAGVRWASMQKLLQEGEYTPREKRKSRVLRTVSAIYWLVVTAAYLGWSFWKGDWEETWIVWPVAGVLFAAARCVCNLIMDREDEQSDPPAQR